MTAGEPINWAAQWATEILPRAAEAHDVIITGTAEIKARNRTTDGWAISPPDGGSWKDYETNAANTVQVEITKGGFRLAQILEKIWPD